MSIHHLPSIRVHDQPSSYESGFDNSPSVHSIRSQPRDIPFRHSSPTSIRGSYYPTDAPPPVLPLGPIHASEWDKRRDDDLDRHGTRSPMEWGSGNMGRGSMGSHKSSKGNWGSKRLDENMRETRHDFEKVAITERYRSLHTTQNRKTDSCPILSHIFHLSYGRNDQWTDTA